MLEFEIKGTSASSSATVTMALELSVPPDLAEQESLEIDDDELSDDLIIGGIKWSLLKGMIESTNFDLEQFELILTAEEKDLLNRLMIKHGLLTCSDKTMLGGRSWKNLKTEAMAANYKHNDWFVSTSFST